MSNGNREGNRGKFPTMARTIRIHHKIIQTRNTCSRAVLHEDTIVIRLARNLSQEERREHIRSLLRRMMEQVLKEQRKKRIAPFRHLLDGGESLTVRITSGRVYRIVLVPASHTHAQPFGCGRRGWVIEIGPQLRRPALHRFFWNLLAKAEEKRMERLVHTINRQTFRVPLRGTKIAFAKTQWGSCSPQGVIMLNAALLFVPRRILRYVIIHELAHCRVRNHSPRYWSEVASAMPDYRRVLRELHNYRLPTL